jgi:ABC-type glycerol-3-phosphate transport system substrate-binding protein
MKKRGTILAVLLTAIVLAGCGSSGKSEAAAESAAYDAGSYKRSNDFVTADTSAEWDGDYEEAVTDEAPVSGSAETVTEADVKDQGSKIAPLFSGHYENRYIIRYTWFIT